MMYLINRNLIYLLAGIIHYLF